MTDPQSHPSRSSEHDQNTVVAADWRTYGRLLPFMRPYLRPLLFVLCISLAATALTLAQPYLSKLLIDEALVSGDMGALVEIAVAMIVVTIGGFALNIFASYRYVSVSAAILFEIRSSLLRHLQMLSPRFYGGFRLGDLMSRMNSDVSTIQRVAADTFLSVLSNLLLLVGCMAMMLWLDWVLFLLSVVVIPVCMLTFLHYQRKLTALTRDVRERSADIGSLLVDTVMGMRVVVSLRADKHEISRFERSNSAFVRALLRMQVASFLAGALPGSLLAVSTSAIIIYGGKQVIDHQMTIGVLVAFMTYHMRLFTPIQTLMGLTSSLASARVSLARTFELFDVQPEVQERGSAVPLGQISEGLRFEHVSMSHDGRSVLTDVNMEIPHGAFCVILGPSGVGKSTFADLLVRYLDPDAGRIQVDDRDLREVPLADLRREIILVDQSPYLFNDTIAANIAFAMPQASREQIETAARFAGLEGLLRRLPQGIDTRTGERGMKISAGERQRIALARALLRRPSVLVLDEPTSALDSETEQLVVDGLRAALPEATIIIITHRRALSEMADLVVTIDAGRAQVVGDAARDEGRARIASDDHGAA